MSSHDPGYCVANAYLDAQLTILGDWAAQQYITLELADWDALRSQVAALRAALEYVRKSSRIGLWQSERR